MLLVLWRLCLRGAPILFVLIAKSSANAVKYSCDPCIERSEYSVRAIVHGVTASPFWKQIQASSLQAGRDMKVDLKMDLYETYDPDKMAADIVDAATGSSKPDALVVTMPTQVVQDAVKIAVDEGIPVFGLNVGHENAKSLGILGWVGMDDYLGGANAADEFQERLGQISKAIFINPDETSSTFQTRWEGFKDKLARYNVTQVETSSSLEIDSAFNGCPYDAVLLGSESLVAPAISASEKNSCVDTAVGTFDVNQEIYDAVAADKLAFAVSQQQHLQGAIPVLLASLYASTGKTLALSAETPSGTYLSGPLIIEKDKVPCMHKHCNLPSDTQQMCEADSFPVCPNTKAIDGTSDPLCDCTDRSKIRIGGVTHGVTTDAFWDIIYSAAEQAASDMGVELLFERFEPEDDEAVLHEKMANKILSLCRDGIDGLFVSIPSDAVEDAIIACKNLNIPVMSINAGVEKAEELGLVHHIGQLEYNAGYAGGERMVENTDIETGFCLNHAEGVSVLIERCGGFRDAIEKAGKTYGGDIIVPADNDALYKTAVENKVKEKVGMSDNWEGIGLFAAGQPNHVPALKVQESYPKVILGVMDVSDELFDALDEKKVIYAIDQNAYFQGYVPVPLLAYMAYTSQDMDTQVIESGPSFVVHSPSEAQQICEANFFKVCMPEVPEEFASSTKGGTSPQTQTGLIATVAVLGCIAVFGIGFLAYRLNKLQNYVKELESQGREVPKLSTVERLSSVCKPVDMIVAPLS